MRIGLDIHQIGERQTGNETYLVNLIEAVRAAPDPRDSFVMYRTRRDAPTQWDAIQRRVWPHQPLVRIPVSFPIALKRDAIDVAHFQYVTPPVCPCPVSVMVHDISYETYPEYFSRASVFRMRTLIPFSARRAQAVFTVSEFSRGEIVRLYGLRPADVIVTYPGAAAEFRPISAAEQTAALAGLDVPPHFVLAVGNVQPRKNLPRLLEAYAQARAGGVDVPPLVLVGQAHFRGREILRVIERLRLTEHVRITGYVTTRQLVALYNRASVFMFASLYEGFGIPILEAMACGTPVVTSTVTSMPEVAGDAALMVDPMDVHAIATAMVRVLSDPELADDLRARGLQRATMFSWADTAARTMAVWRSIAAAR